MLDSNPFKLTFENNLNQGSTLSSKLRDSATQDQTLSEKLRASVSESGLADSNLGRLGQDMVGGLYQSGKKLAQDIKKTAFKPIQSGKDFLNLGKEVIEEVTRPVRGIAGAPFRVLGTPILSAVQGFTGKSQTSKLPLGLGEVHDIDSQYKQATERYGPVLGIVVPMINYIGDEFLTGAMAKNLVGNPKPFVVQSDQAIKNFEQKLGRKLTPEELKIAKQTQQDVVSQTKELQKPEIKKIYQESKAETLKNIQKSPEKYKDQFEIANDGAMLETKLGQKLGRPLTPAEQIAVRSGAHNGLQESGVLDYNKFLLDEAKKGGGIKTPFKEGLRNEIFESNRAGAISGKTLAAGAGMGGAAVLLYEYSKATTQSGKNKAINNLKERIMTSTSTSELDEIYQLTSNLPENELKDIRNMIGDRFQQLDKMESAYRTGDPKQGDGQSIQKAKEEVFKAFPFTSESHRIINEAEIKFLSKPGKGGLLKDESEVTGMSTPKGAELNNFIVKYVSPISKAASRFLIDKTRFFQNLDKANINVKSTNPRILAHEMLHQIFDNSPMSERRPNRTKNPNAESFGVGFLKKWDEIAASDPDSPLSRIDDHINRDYNTEEMAGADLATERFAYLGELVGEYGVQIIPEKLRPYYSWVFDFSKTK